MSLPKTDNRAGLKRWQKIYDRTCHQCVYCGEDLLSNLHTYHSSTEDHLYPRSPPYEALPRGSDGQVNVVPACHVCNALKADFIPPEGLFEPAIYFVPTEKGLWFVNPEKREEYIELIRKKIRIKRAEREQEMLSERQRTNWQSDWPHI